MPDYSIWALEYVQLPGYPDTALIYGATEGTRMLPFYYFVLQHGDHNALVNCGVKDNEYSPPQTVAAVH